MTITAAFFAAFSSAFFPALLAASAAFGDSGSVDLIEPTIPPGIQAAATESPQDSDAELPKRYPPRDLHEGWVRTLQSGAGLMGGALVGATGLGIGISLVDCSDDPDVDTFGCGIAKAAFAIIGASTGYVIGTSLGVYLAGKGLYREGSFWAGFAGAAVGFAAGALMANQFDLETTPMLLLTLGASNLFSVGTYAWSDRVQARVGFAPEPGLRDRAQLSARDPGSMRTEVRLVLWRP